MWSEKYRPNSLKDVIGDRYVLKQLEDFVLNYKNQKKRAAILFGPAGTGKTCAVYAIAKERGLELVELNASDFRNKEQINSIVKNAINQASLFSKGKIILVDEIDGLSGTQDRGGIQAIISLLDKSVYPIVLTANNIYDDRFSKLRSRAILLEFKEISNKDVLGLLKRIADEERLDIEERVLKIIANRSGGDLRGAINDLQSLSKLKEITDNELGSIGDRKKEQEIIAILNLIFKSKDIELISKMLELLDVDLDEVMLWVDENVPLEYDSNELAGAYEMLSKADVFRGRIRKWQYWRFIIYQKFLMTEGVALVKGAGKKGFVRYRRSQRPLKIWRANIKYGKRKTICSKMAERLHISTKRAMQEVLPYVKNILKEKEYALYFDLEEDEISWLREN
jgi:replication factor C large subunit